MMQIKSMKNKLNLIGKIISILSVVFIIYAAVKMGYSLDLSIIENWKIFLIAVLVGLVIKTLTVFIQGNGWAEWLKFFSGTSFAKRDALKVYVKANIGKYMPGNVMHYVERNLFAKNLGVTQKNAAFCSVLEIGGLIIVALVSTVCFSYTQILEIMQYLFGQKYQYVIGLGMVLLLVFVGGVSWILIKKFGKDFPKIQFLKTLILNLAQYFIVLVALGTILIGLCLSVNYNLNARNTGIILASYIASWVLGFIIPGAPGGIGVRELVLTVLAGNVIGKEYILSLTLIHRGITIVGDFLAYLIIFFSDGQKEKRGEK